MAKTKATWAMACIDVATGNVVSWVGRKSLEVEASVAAAKPDLRRTWTDGLAAEHFRQEIEPGPGYRMVLVQVQLNAAPVTVVSPQKTETPPAESWALALLHCGKVKGYFGQTARKTIRVWYDREEAMKFREELVTLGFLPRRLKLVPSPVGSDMETFHYLLVEPSAYDRSHKIGNQPTRGMPGGLPVRKARRHREPEVVEPVVVTSPEAEVANA